MIKNKGLKILRNILIVIVAIIVVFLLAIRIYFRAPVHSYYKASQKAFVIPGLNENYIAQGISYDAATDNFFLTGYMNDGSASPVYVVNKTTKKLVKSVRLANPDGSEFTGHCGGLSVFNDKVYIAGGADCCLYVLSKNSVLNAKDKSSVKYTETVELKNASDMIGVAFTTVHDNMLFAGEFYREPAYPTLDSHKVLTSDGFNKALSVGFTLEGNVAVPEAAYSIPGNIQGMCFGDDAIYLSTSYGPAFAHVYKYEYKDVKQNGTKVVCGKEVPLYILETANCTETYKIAPMAEELEYVDGRIYITNESASSKYKFGKITGGKWCLSTKF